VSAEFSIRHPVANDKVISAFILAQGDTTLSGLDLIGIIRDSDSREVARSMWTTSPPVWHIPFTNVPIGERYSLQVMDADGNELGCSGPFNVVETFGPPVFYPHTGDTMGTNVTPYGSTTSPPVTSKMERNGMLLQNGTATPGLPANQWGQQYTNLPAGPNYDVKFTATDGTGDTAVSGLRIQ
jgi:hypothetical protein